MVAPSCGQVMRPRKELHLRQESFHTELLLRTFTKLPEFRNRVIWYIRETRLTSTGNKKNTERKENNGNDDDSNGICDMEEDEQRFEDWGEDDDVGKEEQGKR